VNDLINLQSKEDIQQTLPIFENDSCICSINYYHKAEMASCLIYTASCVNTLNCYYITNNFAGGIFKSVSKISLFDEKPFEHDFFMEISKSFPFVKTLSITNTTPQQKNDQNHSKIIYLDLVKLDFDYVHDDYIEQFLLDSKTEFCKAITIGMEYNQLVKVTRNFKRTETKNNCLKAGYSID
jgi:hypothetical protein